MTRAALVLVLLVMICCAAFQVRIGAPARGLVKFAPPPVYALWWAKDEECAGFTTPMSHAVASWWFTAENEIISANGEWADGTFLPDGTIVLRRSTQSDETVVRHEMLHALLAKHGIGGHPPEYFITRCHLVAA